MCEAGASIIALATDGRGIDLAEADDAVVGVDAHDQAVLAAVGDGGIDGAGRPQQDRLNLGDPHRFAITP